MVQNSQGAQAAGRPVSLKDIFFYNLAGFTFNIYDTVLYTWIAYFFTPPPGLGKTQYIPLAFLGIILAGGRILDAITDPLMGYLSDHTKSKWGRRKPYIFISNPVLFLAFIFIWLPPVNGTSMINVLVLAGLLFVYYISYTGLLIPWFAVLPEMSPHNEMRVRIASIGVAMGVMGALLGGALSGPLITLTGFFIMALVLGGAAFIAGQLTNAGVRESYTPDHELETPGFFRVVKEVFLDRQVLSFSAMIMLVQLTYVLMLMNVPYMTKLILDREEADASILMGEVIIFTAFSVPIWYKLLNRYTKKRVFQIIISTMTVGFILCFFIGSYPFGTPFVQALVIFPIVAIPTGGMFITVLGVIADLTDYDELKTGKRREAMYYGIYGIVRKTGWALCALILAGTFSVFGYSMDNPFGVRVIWLVCALSCLIGLFAFIPYKIGDSMEKTKKIMGL